MVKLRRLKAIIDSLFIMVYNLFYRRRFSSFL
jgi:hypothetical protein